MTQLAYADRVQESATGIAASGSIPLLGADAGFRSFASAGLNGDTVPYTIQHRTSGQWEVGYGVYTSSGALLARAVVLSNSNGNTSLVNFQAGTVDVWNDFPASKLVSFDADTNTLHLPGALVVAGSANLQATTVTSLTASGLVTIGTATTSPLYPNNGGLWVTAPLASTQGSGLATLALGPGVAANGPLPSVGINAGFYTTSTTGPQEHLGLNLLIWPDPTASEVAVMSVRMVNPQGLSANLNMTEYRGIHVNPPGYSTGDVITQGFGIKVETQTTAAMGACFALATMGPADTVYFAGPTNLQSLTGTSATFTGTLAVSSGLLSLNGISYTAPSAGPAVTGYVLSATTGGVMSWVAQTGGGGGQTLTIGNQLTGGSYNGSAPVTIGVTTTPSFATLLVSGNVGLAGSAINSAVGLQAGGQTTTGASQWGAFLSGVFDATLTSGTGIDVATVTAASNAATTLRGIRVRAASLGSGSSVTTRVGLDIDSQAGSGVGTAYAIRTGTGLVSFGDAVSLSSTLNVTGTTTLAAMSATNITSTGTFTINGLTYTFPSSQTASYFLQTNGSGTLTWASAGGGSLQTLTFGTHLTGTSYNGGTPVTIATDAVSTNTASTLVARDGSGNFSAGTVTATLSGAAPAGSLSGTTLNATVVTSSLTSVGILASPHFTSPTIDSGGLTITAGALTGVAATLTGLLTTAASATGGAGFTMPQGTAPTSPNNGDEWNTSVAKFVRLNGVTQQLVPTTVTTLASLSLPFSQVTGTVGATQGGTGVANNSTNTLTYSGNFGLTLTLSATTAVTLPTSGTLVNSAVTTLSSLTSVGILASTHLTSPVIDSGGLTITSGTLTGVGATLSGVLSVTAGTTTFNGNAYTWPSAAPTNGYVLSWNTGGTLTWIAAGGGSGTVTSVSGTTNQISVATGTTTPVISIASTYVGQASITTVGTLSAGAVPASLLTAGTAGGSTLYTFPGITIATGGAAGAATLALSATGGMTIGANTGSVSDFTLFTPGGTAVLSIPTGTKNLLMSNGSLISTLGTLTTNLPAVSATQTWNAVGTTFQAFLVNVTKTAAATASRIMDIQLGGTSCLNVDSSGNVNAGNTLSVTGNITGGNNIFNSAGGLIGWSGNAYMLGLSGGTIQLLNGAETAFSRLILGPNTTSGVALTVDTATSLSVTLGNGTGNAQLTTGNHLIAGAGNGLTIKGGSNAKAGSGTLSGGTLAVGNTSVTANSKVFVQDTGGGVAANIGTLEVTSKTAGTGFTVTSSNALDSSTFDYWILEVN